MRKNLIGRLLIAATALTPLVPGLAQAQSDTVVLVKNDRDRGRSDWGRGDRGGNGGEHSRGDRGGNGGGGDFRGRGVDTAPRADRAPQPQPRGPEVRQREWQGGGMQEAPRAPDVRQREWNGGDRQGGLSERTRDRTDDRRYDDRRDDRRGDDRRYDDGRRDGWRDGDRRGDRRYDNDRRDDRRYDDNHRDNRGWNNRWRSDRRYDWQDHRQRYGNTYRLSRYYSPYRGHHYTRFSIGFNLWPNFYGSQYWINDPWAYRLPEAYGPYRWVRYYDDVLLVDVRSGRVVDVIYDFFW
ncbi:MAG: hypothetical protein RLZZ58_1761 [Pseudomonadota bacterium]